MSCMTSSLTTLRFPNQPPQNGYGSFTTETSCLA
jgi:hypothetical protein